MSVYVPAPAPCQREKNLQLRVHALDKGSVPVLLSIDTLKRIRAIVDYGNDEAVFVAVNPKSVSGSPQPPPVIKSCR